MLSVKEQNSAPVSPMRRIVSIRCGPPDHQHVARAKAGKGLVEAKPPHRHAGNLILEHGIAACRMQRRPLQVKVLVVSRDLSIANIHAAILNGPFGMHKLLETLVYKICPGTEPIRDGL